MNQPNKSVRMSFRLLFIWLGRKFSQTWKKLWNVLTYRLKMRGKAGYAIQGQLAQRLNIEGKYLDLDGIVAIAQQSQHNNDDVFFDYQSDSNISLTIRLFRAEDQQSLIIEVLPDAETSGVFIKQTKQQGLLSELRSTFTADDHHWFEQNHYHYTPW